MKANRIIKIIICVLLIIQITPAVYINAASDMASAGKQNQATQVSSNPDIKAPSFILTDSGRGQVLYGREPDSKLHIAALCKLMTILIAVENSDLASPVTISKDSLVDAQGSVLNLEAGDKYPLGDLLSAIMLTSANDAANAVAEHISKDIPSFVKKMNETAVRLKMDNTRFINPTGLYDEYQYTTAHDISTFIKYAVKNKNFSSLFSVRLKPWIYKDGTSKLLSSSNSLFWSYNGIDGGKTGYNTKDKQTVISAASRDNMQLICIILDSPEATLFKDAEALFDYGFQNFRKSVLVQKGEEIKTVRVNNADVVLVSGSDEYYVHPAGSSFIKNLTISANPEAPILTSKLAGNARYTLEDDTIIDVGLYPATQAPPPADDFITSARKKLLQNMDILYLLVFLLFIEAVLMLSKIIKLFKWLVRKLFKV